MTNDTSYDIIIGEAAGNKIENGGEVFNDYENNTADGSYSHAEGENTAASGRASHTEGSGTTAGYTGSHAEGENSSALGHGAHAENSSTAEGDYSHSEGYLSKTTGANSHAEGTETLSSGQNSHAEGENTVASGTASHSEGKNTTASGEKSHAEGENTKATGSGAHAEGSNTTASGEDSHAEGSNTYAVGARSHACGNSTVAGYIDQTVIGRFNQNGTDTLFEVGNGTSDTERSNAFEVYKDGTLSIGGETVSPEQFERLLSMLGATKDKAFNVLFDGEQFTAQLSAGKEQWYKITTDIPNAHVNGNIGEYIFNIGNGEGYEFTIYDSGNNTVCTIDPTESPLAPIELLFDRTYYLCVKALADEPGSYTLSFDYVNQRELLEEGFANAEDMPVWNGTEQAEGSFSEPFERKWYKITAVGYQTHINGDPGEYYFTVNSDSPTTTILYMPDGTEIGRNFNTVSGTIEQNTLTCMLDSGGYYYVAVKSASSDAATFSLCTDYKHLPYPGTTKEVAILMPFGQNYDETFFEPNGEKWFKYTADKAQYHQGGDPAGYSFSGIMSQDFVAEITDEKGNPVNIVQSTLHSRDFAYTVEMNLGDTYYMHLIAQNGCSGDFYVQVSPNNTIYNTGLSMEDAIIMPFNKWISGSIDTAGQSKWYKFCVEEDCDKVTVESKSTVRVEGYLYDRDGNLITSDNVTPEPDEYITPTDFVISRPLTLAQTYYICVTGKTNGTGTFKLRASNKIPVEEFTVSPSSEEISVGQTYLLTTHFYPSNATDKSLRWYSSNSAIASVDKNGVVTGKSAGSTNIYAVTEDGTNLIDYVTIYVETAPYSVAMFPEALTICVGNTEQLTALERPLGSAYDRIVWTVDKPDVVSVSNTGKITAKKVGSATVTATLICKDTNKTKYTAECFVTVEKEKVIIYRIDAVGDDANGELRVRFTDSGKIWRVVNHDTIYYIDDYNLDPLNPPPNGIDPRLLPPGENVLGRCYDNLYAGHDFSNLDNHNPIIKEYDDDEIKLLYAIDPYGVADYVYRRAQENIPLLKDTVNYKDQIFFKLFNRKPNYYSRDIEGKWGLEDDTNDLSKVISESEIIFGIHHIFDIYAKRQLFEVAATLISLAAVPLYPPAIAPALIAPIDSTDVLQSIYSFMAKIEKIVSSEDKATSIAEELIGYAFEKFELGWINDLIALQDGFQNLANTYSSKPNICDAVFEYHIHNERFLLSIELNENETLTVEKIKEAIAF